MPAALLRLCTAGSVDDGKSTLIGRLLHDSRAVYEDQVRSVQAASRGRTAGPIDFSLFTDGLKAEREQGITIDVAYRYFATPRRTFILADTPGHEQYTRNMATGASTADAAVLVVDVARGLREQSLRHARIARLMGITHFVLAINKMDLIGFDAGAFDDIRARFVRAAGGGTVVQAIPVSALHGDNIIERSPRMPWYGGPPLLGHLETIPTERADGSAPFRMPVQAVLRGAEGFRGYAGRIASGRIAPGQPVQIWPSGVRTSIGRIVTRDGDLPAAEAAMSVALVLADDVDAGRGDVFAGAADPPETSSAFEAQVVWMDERALEPHRLYALKQGTRTVWAEVNRALALNEIGTVAVTVSRPLTFDPYGRNRLMGGFILIDPDTNFTAGAGMIASGIRETRRAGTGLTAAARLAAAARTAATEAEAVARVGRVLEEMLT